MNKQYLYIATSPNFSGTYTIKIGITNNPVKRLLGLRSFDRLLKINNLYEFRDMRLPAIIEGEVVSNFSHTPLIRKQVNKDGSVSLHNIGREWFEGCPKDFIKYVEIRIKHHKAVVVCH